MQNEKERLIFGKSFLCVLYLPEAEGSRRVTLWLAGSVGQDTLDWEGVVADVSLDCGHLQHHRALTRLGGRGKGWGHGYGSISLS